MTALAYYPGCSLHSTATEMDESFQATCTRLGLELREIPGWECCGNTAAHSTNRLLAAALPANELAKVKDDMKLDAVAVPCAACFSRFMTAAHELTEDAHLAADVTEVVGRPYTGGVTVWNMVDVYHDGVGVEALKAKVRKPFGGLKVACYYGCLLTRPPKVTLAEDPEYPTHMDAVVEALGCAPVEWGYKTDCCGASLALCEQEIVVALTRKILENARECGAEALVAACPLCQVNLDTRQGDIAKADPSFAAAVAKKRKADNSSASEDDIFDWIGSSMKESTEGQQYVTGVLCRGIVSRTFSSSGPKDNPLHPVILDFRNRYLAKRIVESPADKIYITYGGAHLPGVVEELRKLNPNWKLVSIKWMRSIAAPENLEGTLSLIPARNP